MERTVPDVAKLKDGSSVEIALWPARPTAGPAGLLPLACPTDRLVLKDDVTTPGWLARFCQTGAGAHQPSGARRRPHLRRGNLASQPARLEPPTGRSGSAWPLIAGQGTWPTSAAGGQLPSIWDWRKWLAYFVRASRPHARPSSDLGSQNKLARQVADIRGQAQPAHLLQWTSHTSGPRWKPWWKDFRPHERTVAKPRCGAPQVAYAGFSSGLGSWAVVVRPLPLHIGLHLDRAAVQIHAHAAFAASGKRIEGGVSMWRVRTCCRPRAPVSCFRLSATMPE